MKLRNFFVGLLLTVLSFAGIADQSIMFSGGTPPPTLSYQFAADGSLTPRVGSAAITFTRGSAANYFNSSGTLTSASTNTARFDYNPSTLIARGLLIEEARTNSIRNNTMVGASAGTPGTAPTNWIMSAAAGNLTALNVVGTGTENGISYVDLRWITSGAINDVLVFEQTTQIVASDTQTWTGSQYCKLVGGSLTNVALGNRVQFRTAAGANVSTSDPAFTPTSSGLATQRNITTFTASGGTIARVTNGILLTFSGAADVTLRIGMPQLELGAFATSVISTSTVAVTRAADLASITGANFTSFWNATQGTIVVGYAVASDSSTSIFPGAVSVTDGTLNNRISLYSRTIDDTNLGDVITGGVSQANIQNGSIVYGTNQKAALAYQANNVAYSSKGLASVADTSVTLPTVDRIELGVLGVGTAWLNGWISSLSYYPVRLPNWNLPQFALAEYPTQYAFGACYSCLAANDDQWRMAANGG